MKQNETFGLVLIIGVLVIAMGSSSSTQLTIADKFHSECIDYVDNDNDGVIDSFMDSECHEYPYNDGNGENITNSQDMFREGSQNYDVYNDFFEYANYSYSDITIITGYPGSIEDYRCDLIDLGTPTYMKTYDVAFGTNTQGQLDDWYFINCIQAGNGGFIKGGR
jgi:hypothetical protein